jgi:hypothetical protein
VTSNRREAGHFTKRRLERRDFQMERKEKIFRNSSAKVKISRPKETSNRKGGKKPRNEV